MSLFTNPEIVRNARIQLRPKRMISAAALCAALEVALIYFFLRGGFAVDSTTTVYGGGQGLLRTILWIQAAVLVIGGGIASIHAIQREKDQNTFDFQRLTRLSPLGLAIGKLFGPPLMVYFVFVCLLPAAIVGAVAGGASWEFVLAAYFILVLGAIAYMAFALVISLFLQRGTATWAILFYLLLVFLAAQSVGTTNVSMGTVSPFFATELAQQSTWNLAPTATNLFLRNGMPLTIPNHFEDLFFGGVVHHAVVLPILFLTLIAWFIPAVARNIKRDPTSYELYTPPQALAFLCYLNFILFAFFQWRRPFVSFLGARSLSALGAQSMLLTVNIVPFFIFGLILLRNRNRMRRRLHGIEAGPASLESIWPAPYIFLGAILIGAAMVGVIQWKRNPALEWSLAVAIFRVIYFAVWISCDLLFLQWMNLRRGRHPLPLGVLYLIVYYVCAGLVVGALHLTQNPFTAIFLPTPLWELNTTLWSARPAEWIVALLAVAAMAIVFIFLQRQQIAQLQPRPIEARDIASASAV
ncbi:MAG TPA: hypothetical protein VGU63_15705 [Candidatus Acidoferrales bacterium]|nr:hypothetical protein [Candidatus Acidoferrales bacterium]